MCVEYMLNYISCIVDVASYLTPLSYPIMRQPFGPPHLGIKKDSDNGKVVDPCQRLILTVGFGTGPLGRVLARPVFISTHDSPWSRLCFPCTTSPAWFFGH